MNAQLFAHMETFDSDEEYSEDPSLYEDEEDEAELGTETPNPVDGVRIKTKVYVRKFVKPRNINDLCFKLLTLLPIGIALGDYVGLLWSMPLSVICFVLLQLRPPPRQPPLRQERISAPSGLGLPPISSASSASAQRLTRRSSTGSSGSSSGQRRDSLSHRTKRKSKLPEDVLARLERAKKQVHDCRKEVSRLLGLSGAQPMAWRKLDATEMNDILNAPSEGGDDPGSSTACCITDLATISVVKFLEAHVQFLMTIDHAYYWMKVTASLHLGLGPQSHCVERVERAAIAKEFRNRRRRSITASLIEGGISTPLEAQRKVDSSSILSLSSARRHLAEAIVAQSESLVDVYRHIHMATRKLQREENPNDEATGVADLDDVQRDMESKLLEMPNVIDLAWIKASRKHLGVFLSFCVDEYCTVACLRTLSEELAPRSKLDESMWNARNSREYLICNLLLGKESSARPLDTNAPKSEEELMLSLLQYRQQIDALGAALWSCQHYTHDVATTGLNVGRSTHNRTTIGGGNNAPTAAEILQQEEDSEAAKVEWWKQVKEMGAACHALEKEIEDRHFAYVLVDATAYGEDVPEADGSYLGDGLEQRGMAAESGSYEHGNDRDGTARRRPNQAGVATNKVLVFSGRGSVDEGPATKTNRTTAASQGREARGGGTTWAPTPLPEKDTAAEQRLVRELQNRIRTMALLEEQDQIAVLDEEEPITMDTATLGKGGTGGRERLNVIDQTAETIDTIEDSIGGSSSSSSRDLETTASLFLGATGALLGELKQYIPPVQEHYHDETDDSASTED